jgi:transcriptional/translational regulatory protein YebC/TACO1
VAYLFEPQGVVELPGSAEEEAQCIEWGVESGANDVRYEANAEGDELWRFFSDSHDVYTVAEALSALLPTSRAGQLHIIQHRVPATMVSINDATVAKPLLKLLNALEEHDDVETVYCNADFSDALLQELG